MICYKNWCPWKLHLEVQVWTFITYKVQSSVEGSLGIVYTDCTCYVTLMLCYVTLNLYSACIQLGCSEALRVHITEERILWRDGSSMMTWRMIMWQMFWWPSVSHSIMLELQCWMLWHHTIVYDKVFSWGDGDQQIEVSAWDDTAPRVLECKLEPYHWLTCRWSLGFWTWYVGGLVTSEYRGVLVWCGHSSLFWLPFLLHSSAFTEVWRLERAGSCCSVLTCHT